MISKTASNQSLYQRPCYWFKSAREAFKALLKETNFRPGEKLLLPSYIGWSEREGSGVFDPVRWARVEFSFYQLNEDLTVDLLSLKKCLQDGNIKVLLLIHYFGLVDGHYEEIVRLAKQYGVIVIEDEAHAMYTDLIGGLSGRLGDASIFSLHKMLPMKTGGMLILNSNASWYNPHFETQSEQGMWPWEYDLTTIAKVRVENYQCLCQLLLPHEECITLLRPSLKPGEIPQTLPVLIKTGKRDKAYFDLNEAGYGVVSLYHTLIQEISKKDFPASHSVAEKILNLPVHQEVQPALLKAMVHKFIEVVSN